MRKRQHLAGHAFIQPVNARNSVADRDHRPDLVHRQRLLVVFDLFAQYFCNLVGFNIRHSQLLSFDELFRFQLFAQTVQLLAHRSVVNRRTHPHHHAAQQRLILAILRFDFLPGAPLHHRGQLLLFRVA